MMRLRHVTHVTFLQVKQNWPVLLHRIEPNSNTASQIQSACNCASGCNNWADLSTPPSTSADYMVLNNAEVCTSPCQEVTSPQANAQCQVKTASSIVFRSLCKIMKWNPQKFSSLHLVTMNVTLLFPDDWYKCTISGWNLWSTIWFQQFEQFESLATIICIQVWGKLRLRTVLG